MHSRKLRLTIMFAASALAGAALGWAAYPLLMQAVLGQAQVSVYAVNIDSALLHRLATVAAFMAMAVATALSACLSASRRRQRFVGLSLSLSVAIALVAHLVGIGALSARAAAAASGTMRPTMLSDVSLPLELVPVHYLSLIATALILLGGVVLYLVDGALSARTGRQSTASA